MKIVILCVLGGFIGLAAGGMVRAGRVFEGVLLILCWMLAIALWMVWSFLRIR